MRSKGQLTSWVSDYANIMASIREAFGNVKHTVDLARPRPLAIYVKNPHDNDTLAFKTGH
ncbi:MAG: hypothetical protein JRF37_06170 [Deltaproteobacteria bacterium]|nr:hypothetical protein [Deltaproteobacteria bacterium]